MKKMPIVLLFFLILSSAIFAQEERVTKERYKMDIDLNFYLPSGLGFVTGSNPFLGLREDSSTVDSCFNFMIEGRGSIATIDRFTFSWSFASGGYIEHNKSQDNLFSVDVSLGGGIYFHPFDMKTYPLSGMCLYLYPMYDVPVYKENASSYLAWKSAIDFGYNFTLIEVFSVYPYMRAIVGWNSKDVRFGFDFGVALGFYIHDCAPLVYGK